MSPETPSQTLASIQRQQYDAYQAMNRHGKRAAMKKFRLDIKKQIKAKAKTF